MQSTKTVPTNLAKTMVYMPDDLKEELVRWASRENRSLSNLIVTLLQESVKNAKATGKTD